MPILLGEEFRTSDILNRQLFRKLPVDAPMMLAEEAYTLLGKGYLNKKDIVPALECYKFALDQQTSFIGFVSSMQDSALLTPEEISHLELESPLETALINEVLKSRKGSEINMEKYNAWLENLRALKKQYYSLNRKVYSLDPFQAWDKIDGAKFGYHRKTGRWILIKNYPFSEEFKDCARLYIDVCVSRGQFDEVILLAEYFGASFKRKIISQRPKEILDTKWLKKYVYDNHPKSSLED